MILLLFETISSLIFEFLIPVHMHVQFSLNLIEISKVDLKSNKIQICLKFCMHIVHTSFSFCLFTLPIGHNTIEATAHNTNIETATKQRQDWPA